MSYHVNREKNAVTMLETKTVVAKADSNNSSRYS